MYNFDEYVDRSGTNAWKLEKLVELYGTEDVIPLWIADMDFHVAEPIVKAAQRVVDRKLYGYSNRPAEYFKSYADWQLKRNGFDADTSLMSHAPGAIAAVEMTIETLTNEGDGILIQTPVYPPFFTVIEERGRVVHENRLVYEEGVGYSIDFDDFEEKVKDENVKAFLFCSPHNPTGNVWKREELEKMVELCVKHNVLILSDEVHSDLILFGNEHIPTASLSEEARANTITYLSPTKTFNLAGIQTSIALFNNQENKNAFEDILSRRKIVRSNVFSIDMCIAAFEEGEEWLEELLLYIEGNVNYVVDFIREYIPGVSVYKPESTYLLWIDFNGLGLIGDKLNEFLVQDAKLALNDGKAYGEQALGFYRTNVATSRENLEKAMQNLKNAVEKL